MDNLEYLDPENFGGCDGPNLEQPPQPCGCNDGPFCTHLGGFLPQAPPANDRPFSALDLPQQGFQPSSSNLQPEQVPWQSTTLPRRLSIRTLPQRPLLSRLQAQSQELMGTGGAGIMEAMEEVYTPGFGASLPYYPTTNLGMGQTPVTPVTGVPSIAEEDETWTAAAMRLRCPDFLNKGTSDLQLQTGSTGCYFGASLLVDDMINQGYRVNTSSQTGVESALSALQIGLGGKLSSGRHPLTLVQLRNILQNTRAGSTDAGSDAVSSSSLLAVLMQSGLQSGEQFHLGVICKGGERSVYNAVVHWNPQHDNGMKTVWVFYDFSGEDTGSPNQWSAIVPQNTTSHIVSYATVAAAPAPPPPPPPPAPAPERVNPVYLHADYSPPKPRYQNRRQLLGSPVSRSRAGKFSRTPSTRSGGANSGRGRRSSKSSRASSECGTVHSCDNCSKLFETQSELSHHQRKYAEKTHRCEQCGVCFVYPKDLRRHESTHSGCKPVRCPYCTKSYSRGDNLNRHIRDSHPEHAPVRTNGVTH